MDWLVLCWSDVIVPLHKRDGLVLLHVCVVLMVKMVTRGSPLWYDW